MRGLLLHGFKCGFWFSLEHLPYFCQTEIFYSFHRSWGCLRRIVKLAFWFSLENYITLPQTELLLPFWASFIRVFLCLHGLNQHFNSVWRIMLSNIPLLIPSHPPLILFRAACPCWSIPIVADVCIFCGVLCQTCALTQSVGFLVFLSNWIFLFLPDSWIGAVHCGLSLKPLFHSVWRSICHPACPSVKGTFYFSLVRYKGIPIRLEIVSIEALPMRMLSPIRLRTKSRWCLKQ